MTVWKIDDPWGGDLTEYDRCAIDIKRRLVRLRASGVGVISLAIISNGFEEDVVGWSKCLLAPKFQFTVFSCAEHVAKPDAEIYLRAVQRLGAEPAMTAYIGDGADDELAGAERAGLQTGR